MDTKPAAVEDVPNAIDALLAEPLNLQGGTRKYYGRKTKKAAHKSKRKLKVALNARRQQGGRHGLVKGYNKMPHDHAEKVRDSEVFVPTIFIDTPRAHEQFDKDFPIEERQHGFMVSCKGMILYWDTTKKDFGTELVALPI